MEAYIYWGDGSTSLGGGGGLGIGGFYSKFIIFIVKKTAYVCITDHSI